MAPLHASPKYLRTKTKEARRAERLASSSLPVAKVSTRSYSAYEHFKLFSDEVSKSLGVLDHTFTYLSHAGSVWQEPGRLCCRPGVLCAVLPVGALALVLAAIEAQWFLDAAALGV